MPRNLLAGAAVVLCGLSLGASLQMRALMLMLYPISQLDIDYTPLKELLAAGEFEKADDFTRATLIVMVRHSDL